MAAAVDMLANLVDMIATDRGGTPIMIGMARLPLLRILSTVKVVTLCRRLPPRDVEDRCRVCRRVMSNSTTTITVTKRPFSPFLCFILIHKDTNIFCWIFEAPKQKIFGSVYHTQGGITITEVTPPVTLHDLPLSS